MELGPSSSGITFLKLAEIWKKNESRKKNWIEHLTLHIKSGNDDYLSLKKKDPLCLLPVAAKFYPEPQEIINLLSVSIDFHFLDVSHKWNCTECGQNVQNCTEWLAASTRQNTFKHLSHVSVSVL